MKPRKLQYAQPTEEELREAALELAKYISPNKVLVVSKNEKIRGTFQKGD